MPLLLIEKWGPHRNIIVKDNNSTRLQRKHNTIPWHCREISTLFYDIAKKTPHNSTRLQNKLQNKYLEDNKKIGVDIMLGE
jgi:hypothetical protein